jgi:hypothetical protein
MSRPRFYSCDAGQVDVGNPGVNDVVSTYVAHEPGKWTVRYTFVSGQVVDHQARDWAAQPARPVSAETARATANNGKYPPAEPGALIGEPLKAAVLAEAKLRHTLDAFSVALKCRPPPSRHRVTSAQLHS